MDELIDKIIEEMYLSYNKIMKFKILKINYDIIIDDIKKINDFVDASSGIILGLFSADIKKRDRLQLIYNNVKETIDKFNILNINDTTKFYTLYNQMKPISFYSYNEDKTKLENVYEEIINNINQLLHQKLFDIELFEIYHKHM